MNKQVILLDVDNVLTDSTGHAIDKLNLEHNENLSVEDIVDYSLNGFKYRTGYLGYFHQKEFIKSLTPSKGAIDLVDKLLQDGHQVMFCTSVYTDVMDERVEWLRFHFPNVPRDNYILTQHKNLIAADVIVDDVIENITSSRAKNKLLLRKPWNKNAELPSVNTLEEVYLYINKIAMMNALNINDASIICLVGPSASGKTALQAEICKHPDFLQPISCTTRLPRPGEINGVNYHFLTREEFEKDIHDGMFIEYATYAGQMYGMHEHEIYNILKNGHKAVIVTETSGALALKNKFGNKCITIFIEREKPDIIEAILDRDIPKKEKVSRINNLEQEYKAIKVCDYAIINSGSIDQAVSRIFNLIQ